MINREVGLAVRVIVDGTWGFASHAELAPSVAAETARRAVHVATTLATLSSERVELAPEPVYRDATWVSSYWIDPFDVSAADKIGVLGDYSGRLLAADGIDHVSALLTAVKEQTFYADTFGSSITQQRVRVLPSLEAVTVDAQAGSFDSMRTLAPPMGRGWEALAGDEVWNWTDELAQLPSLLAEKVKAPTVVPGPTDLVIDPTNLWLTIHESIGHATEYDRAIGYEAAYAGTSFATPDKLGTMRYGSPVMNVTADRTVEFGLATIGYDDEGWPRKAGIWCATGFSPVISWTGCSPGGSDTPLQRLLVRGFAASRAHPAHGQCLAAARPRTDQHRRLDRPGRGRHLHRRRQVVVNRHAALQLSVHRPAVLPDSQRATGRPTARRRLSGHHDRFLEFDGGGGRPGHLAAGRGVQLRQGPAGPDRARQPRLPVRAVPRRQCAEHPTEGGR